MEKLISIKGPMSIYEVREIYGDLLKSFDEDGEIILDLSEVTSCDVAGIQLLYSAKRTAKETGKGFSLSGVSSAVLEAAGGAGIELEISEGNMEEGNVKR